MKQTLALERYKEELKQKESKEKVEFDKIDKQKAEMDKLEDESQRKKEELKRKQAEDVKKHRLDQIQMHQNRKQHEFETKRQNPDPVELIHAPDTAIEKQKAKDRSKENAQGLLQQMVIQWLNWHQDEKKYAKRVERERELAEAKQHEQGLQTQKQQVFQYAEQKLSELYLSYFLTSRSVNGKDVTPIKMKQKVYMDA